MMGGEATIAAALKDWKARIAKMNPFFIGADSAPYGEL